MPDKLYCPVCGSLLRPNKGWAAQFYDGYCNTCDCPVEEGVPAAEEGDSHDNTC